MNTFQVYNKHSPVSNLLGNHMRWECDNGYHEKQDLIFLTNGRVASTSEQTLQCFTGNFIWPKPKKSNDSTNFWSISTRDVLCGPLHLVKQYLLVLSAYHTNEIKGRYVKLLTSCRRPHWTSYSLCTSIQSSYQPKVLLASSLATNGQEITRKQPHE